MAEERVQRRLAAILAADVVGFSRLMGEDEAGTLAQLKTLRKEMLDPKVDEYGGRIVKTTGDGFLIEFPSAVDAVEHAVDVQQSLAHRNIGVSEGRRIQLRIGINLGDVIVDDDDLYGDGVNVAARLEEFAEPGGISLSEMVHSGVRNKLDVLFIDLGDQSFKNIAEPVHVFKVNLDAEVLAAPVQTISDAIFRRPAVAVLPFQNLSGDPDQEYFVDGLTEDIITALSLWKSFPVIARNSMFSYKGQAPDIRKVGEELGARYVLEGSVRRAASRVRITAQLINSETGHHVWAERYDRELEDIFDLQDEITHRIVATLVPELERAEREKSAIKAPANLDAWDCYLHGIAFINDLSHDAIPRAREMFARVIDLDPGYAKAHAKMALSYHRELWLNLCDDSDEAARTMLQYAQSAVRLDDSDSFCHTMYALALVWDDHIQLAIQEALRGLELNPIDVDANFSAGTVLAWNGRPKEAILNIENGLKISPNDPRRTMFYSQLAAAYFDDEAFETAIEWARKAIDLGNRGAPNANDSLANLIRISSLGHLNRMAEAQAIAEQAGTMAANFERTEGLFQLRKNTNTNDQIREGLRKAGLSE